MHKQNWLLNIYKQRIHKYIASRFNERSLSLSPFLACRYMSLVIEMLK